MKFKSTLTILILILGLVIPASLLLAQDPDSGLLTLDRIFRHREFRPERFGPARWLADGTGYTTLESADSGNRSRDIVKYDSETGKREVLVSAKDLTPSGASQPLDISGYSWSEDGRKLLIFTNTQRVWRQNTRGDYWVLDRMSYQLEKLGSWAEPSTLMFAKFSPDGTRVAYVVKNNIYVEALADHSVTQLTKDGTETLINGTFDWVYEEEFFLRDGFRWSPDGKRIAYWQLDTEGVKTFYLINNTDSLYPRLIPIPYPKPGETNSSCRVGVVSAQGGDTRWFDLPGDPRDHYIARMEWAANSDEIVIQRLNRRQNTNWLILGDIRTGQSRIVLTEKDEAWTEVVDNIRWMKNGSAFTWVSERDGWRHLYLVTRSGSDVKLLTPGNYDVIDIQAIDENGGWAYFTASPDNPTQRYLYRVPLDGSGKAVRLTPAGQPGTHRYTISPDARWAFHTVSTFDDPPQTDLISLPSHKPVRVLTENADLRNKVRALKRSPVEFFRVPIRNSIELDAWCIKPPDFDPDKKYPLLFYVYGEPAGQTVLDRFGGNRYLWHLMLAQQGYVVMSIDNRGTPAPRGRAWRKSIYKQIGILASEDQAAACREILKSRPYLDADRVGIWGWSGGGSMTLNMMFRHPELYRTGMAVAFVANQRFYDSIYQERYMSLPEDNPDGYNNGSPITFASKLEGNLLMVHGTGDDNVHYQNFEALVNELVRNNKVFTMMAYPNRSHGIFEGENTTLHLYGLLTRFLNHNLPPDPRNYERGDKSLPCE